MHRAILCVPDTMLVDHIDGDGLNNTRANLRPANRQLNAQNRRTQTRKRHDLPPGVKPPRWGRNGRYQSVIWVNKKPVHLGMFDSVEEAALAYMKAKQSAIADSAAASYSALEGMIRK